MKKFKTSIVFFILAIAIYGIYPTVGKFLWHDLEEERNIYREAFQKFTTTVEELKDYNLAIVRLDEKKIAILASEEAGAVFPMENSIIRSILADNYSLEVIEEEIFLKKNPGSSRDVFLSKTAGQLNQLFENLRTITNYELGEESIILFVEEDQKISSLSEPFRTLFQQDFEYTYDEEKSRYLIKQKENDNILNLGLDLVGGIYLDVSVQTDKVIDVLLINFVEDLKTVLAGKIFYRGISITEDKVVKVQLDNNETIDWEETELKAFTRIYDINKTQEGYELSLKEDEKKDIERTALDQALETIRNRIDQLGIKEPSIQKKGDDSIIIQLPGYTSPARAKTIIKTAAVLEFRLMIEEADPSTPGDNPVFAYDVYDHVTGELVSSSQVVLKKQIALQGDTIRQSRVEYSSTTGLPYVSISFNDEGTEKFSDITSKNTGKILAIVLDGKVRSLPRIETAIYSGVASITGSFNDTEASDLALVLRSGSLPAPIVINEERTIGPTLGSESIQKSIIALLSGFLCILLLMMVYYGLSGVFAILSLLFNILLILACLAYFGAILTLPGIAGIILTIGMAVDANILIFERIREELKKSQNILVSIREGFKRATTTVLDANITTIMVAAILFQFGTGPIKGFAITLSIGILASLFTALFVTKLLFEILYFTEKKPTKISI